MDLLDELTERPEHYLLAAPTGLPAPTGQQPVSARHLPEDPTKPSGPRLPPRMPRSAAPPSGQVAMTASAAAAAFATMSQPVITLQPEATAKQRRRHVGAILFLVLLLGAGAGAFALRNSRLADRITGKGYDTNPLPARSFARPSFNGAEYTVAVQSVAMEGDAATNFWDIQRDQVNFTATTAKMTVDEAKATVTAGEVGAAQPTSPTRELVVDDKSTYLPGATPADAWLRRPHLAGSLPAVLSRDSVLMFQDVIDPSMRAVTPTSVESEVRHGVAVTTYTYSIAFGDFRDTAPRLFDRVRMFDGNAGKDAMVTVVVSFDSQWMVRYLDVSLDAETVLAHQQAIDPAAHAAYRYTVDVISTTDKPDDIAVPVKVADAGAETSPDPVAP